MPSGERYEKFAEFYDAFYSFRNYRREARAIVRLIDRFAEGRARTLLDVGCGTGLSLSFLDRRFDCTGLDVSPAMLRVARRRLPGMRLVQGDMRAFSLGTEFDALTCLFSAVGYLTTVGDIRRAYTAFAHHLRPGGVALIVPWLATNVFRPGSVHLQTYVSPELKMARASTAKRQGPMSVIEMQYVVARRGRPLLHFVERHTNRLFDAGEHLRALRSAGFRAQYLRPDRDFDRGVLVAIRRN